MGADKGEESEDIYDSRVMESIEHVVHAAEDSELREKLDGVGSNEDRRRIEISYFSKRIKDLSIEVQLLEAQRDLRATDAKAMYQSLKRIEFILQQATLARDKYKKMGWEAIKRCKILEDELGKASAERDLYSDAIVTHMLREMQAQGMHEAAESIVKMYEERFGPREKLYELRKIEGDKCLRPKNDLIERLLRVYKTGKYPVTAGARIAYCFERLTNTAIEMMKGVYKTLTGRELEAKEKPKSPPVYLKDCG